MFLYALYFSIASLECLMIVFYVHDEADRMDVVLRNQVANVLFIFLPKIVTILYKSALSDDKIGETIKIVSSPRPKIFEFLKFLSALECH